MLSIRLNADGTGYNHVPREIYPDLGGRMLDRWPGFTQQVFSFSLDPSWKFDDLRLVCWVEERLPAGAKASENGDDDDPDSIFGSSWWQTMLLYLFEVTVPSPPALGKLANHAATAAAEAEAGGGVSLADAFGLTPSAAIQPPIHKMPSNSAVSDSSRSRILRNPNETSSSVARSDASTALGPSTYTTSIMSAKTGALPASGGRVPPGTAMSRSEAAQRTR